MTTVRLCACGCGTPIPEPRKPSLQRRYINHHHQRRPLVERFWEKVQPATGPSPNGTIGCLVWTAAHNQDGYGNLGVGGSTVSAHVVAWRLAGYERPGSGLMLDHLCDRRDCVNVAHMRVATNAENCRRGRRGKLTADQVREVRSLAHIDAREVAAMFGISRTHVYRLWNRVSAADIK